MFLLITVVSVYEEILDNVEKAQKENNNES